MVSTTNATASAFGTELKKDTTSGSKVWNEREVSLAAYAGQDIYVAFHHVDEDQAWILFDDITVTEDEPASTEVSITAPASAAAGTAVTFTAEGPSSGTYAWTFPSGTPGAAVGKTATSTWETPGTYTVTLTAVIGSETKTASHSITITEAGAVSIDAPATAASGTAVTFTANGPDDGTYVWSFPGAVNTNGTGKTTTATWNTPGDYTVTLTAVVSGQTKTATHSITITDANAVSIDAPTVGVAGTAVTFTAVGPEGGTYVWSFPSATPSAGTGKTASATWETPGSYTVTLTAVIGSETKTATHSITITEAGAVSIDAPATAMKGETVTFKAVGPADGTYVWNFPGATPSAGTGMTATTTWAEAGTYTVTLTAVVGSDTKTATHTIVITSGQGIDEAEALTVTLAPNPTTGLVRVQCGEEPVQRVEVYNLQGALVLTAQDGEVDLGGQASGTYLLRIVTGTGNTVRRVVKQ